MLFYATSNKHFFIDLPVNIIILYIHEYMNYYNITIITRIWLYATIET